MRIAETLVVAAFMINNLAPIAFSQVNWIKYTNNPVLNATSNTWDNGGVDHHTLLFDGITYKMWYSGLQANTLIKRIGYATSSDLINWTKHPNPVLDVGAQGQWDSQFVTGPYVLYDGTTYKMWYNGGSSLSRIQVGYATSSDGITWMKHSSNPIFVVGSPGSWDAMWVGASTVLFDGTIYKMWYDGVDAQFNFRIGYATSPDGIAWTKHPDNPIFNVGQSGAFDGVWVHVPHVILDGSIYHMWYSGFDGKIDRIGYATSVDGINWIRYSNNPILDKGAAGTWEGLEVGIPRVILDGTNYHMWYVGGDTQSFYRIGYATSTKTTRVDQPALENLPLHFSLQQNYPNPFNPSTTIRYALAQAGHVSLKIFNLAGQEIATLVDGKQNAGEHQIRWQTQSVPSSVYFYQLRAGDHLETRKMILMR